MITLNIFLLPTETLDLGIILLVLTFSLFLGFILAIIYAWTHRLEGFDRSFCVTMMMLPIIVSVIIMLVANNIARAFSLAGVFTLIRFRSTLQDTRDITFVFAAVAIGLITGLGYTGYAVVVTVFIGFVMLVINVSGLDRESEQRAKLKIVIPESLNYPHAFDSIFSSYLISYRLSRVKSTDFGTTFELHYFVKIKKDVNHKKFIDELRVKNGNLNISLTSSYVKQVTE
jgi:hypothetical protein